MDKKEKTINFGVTEELKDFLIESIKNNSAEKEEKEEKPSLGVKRAIAEISLEELSKIKESLKKTDKDDEWHRLFKRVDVIADVNRYY